MTLGGSEGHPSHIHYQLFLIAKHTVVFRKPSNTSQNSLLSQGPFVLNYNLDFYFLSLYQNNTGTSLEIKIHLEIDRFLRPCF